jgi:hypothetical protein
MEASDYEVNNSTDSGDQVRIDLLEELVVGNGCTSASTITFYDTAGYDYWETPVVPNN